MKSFHVRSSPNSLGFEKHCVVNAKHMFWSCNWATSENIGPQYLTANLFESEPNSPIVQQANSPSPEELYDILIIEDLIKQ